MNENLVPKKLALKSLFPHSVSKTRAFYLDKKRDPAGWDLIARNADLERVHEGGRCFVLGNGPSVLRQDLSVLENEMVFTCNRAAQSDQYQTFSSSYHFWMDGRLFAQDYSTAAGKRILETILKVKQGKGDPVVFFEVSMRDIIRDYGIDKALNVRYLMGSHHYSLAAASAIDICKPLPHMPTVVQTAVYTALYMGFRKIVLLGCDCTGFVSVANALSEQPISEEQYCYSMDAVDRQIARNAFKGESIARELENYVELFDTYEVLNEVCKRNGAHLINATEGGLLTQLPLSTLASAVAR